MCGKLSLTILLLGLAISAASAGNTDGERPCNIAVKCSNKADVVWSTDGTDCIPWTNSCQLTNENCQRQNRKAAVLKVVSKEECQLLCNDFCTAEYEPVCGSYNEAKRTFSNSCELTAHVCRTGEIYSLFSQGECK